MQAIEARRTGRGHALSQLHCQSYTVPSASSSRKDGSSVGGGTLATRSLVSSVSSVSVRGGRGHVIACRRRPLYVVSTRKHLGHLHFTFSLHLHRLVPAPREVLRVDGDNARERPARDVAGHAHDALAPGDRLNESSLGHPPTVTSEHCVRPARGMPGLQHGVSAARAWGRPGRDRRPARARCRRSPWPGSSAAAPAAACPRFAAPSSRRPAR
jgi:hypothetical protein